MAQRLARAKNLALRRPTSPRCLLAEELWQLSRNMWAECSASPPESDSKRWRAFRRISPCGVHHALWNLRELIPSCNEKRGKDNPRSNTKLQETTGSFV